MYTLTFCVSSLQKCSSWFFVHFLNWVIWTFFFLLNCTSSLYIVHMKPSSYVQSANIFSYSIGSLFTLLMTCFFCRNFLIGDSPTSLLLFWLMLQVSFSKITKTLCQRAFCACVLIASVMSDSLQPYGLQPIRSLYPWDSPGKNIGIGCHFPPPGDLSEPGIEPTSPRSSALADRFFATGATWEA